MKTVNMTCIGCPLGCSLTAEMDGSEVTRVTGNNCGVGDKYARKELTNPTRIVTSTITVTGGDLSAVSVKTASDIPKAKMFDCIRALKGLIVQAPVSMGQVILPDVCGTGVPVIATKAIAKI